MNKLTPNAEDIDLLLVNGNQFDSLVLLNSTYEKNDDFVNGFYTEIRRLQTSEEGLMLLSRAILALNLLGYPSASQWTLQRALSYWKQSFFNTEVQGAKFTVYGGSEFIPRCVYISCRLGVDCNYVTPSNEQLFSVINSNHDIAYLRGRSIMYSFKYTAKPHEVADSTARFVKCLISGFENV
jgi:hypothetical protein